MLKDNVAARDITYSEVLHNLYASLSDLSWLVKQDEQICEVGLFS